MAATCALALAATTAPAQPGAAPPGPYERARLLVESGRGAAGRLLADSLVARSAPGSPARAEALWWHAALAADGATAERDLHRLIGEVPASPRAGAATVRLAQLALVRDRPDEAAALLGPLVRGPGDGTPGDFARPQAAYWLARARLERRDVVGACAALDSATSAAPDPGLAGQVAALRRRVPGCVEASATGVVAVAPRATVRPGASLALSQPVPPPTGGPPASPTPPAAIPPGPVPGPPPTPPAAPPPASPPSPATLARPAAPAYAVQVAAYDTRPGAEALAARLRATGLDARAEGRGPAGAAAPFRIKVGHYPTRAAAAAALRELRARGLTGFVTTAGDRP